MKCVIKEHHIVGHLVSEAAIHIAQMEGTPIPATPRSVRYRNTDTREEYLCLCGGFAWPGTKPGFAVVAAVMESDNNDRPIIKTIEEIEESDIRNLLRRTYELYKKYGLSCKEIPWMWYGDAENGLNKFIYDFNEKLRETGRDFFFLSPPAYFTAPNRFEIYCRTIYAALKGNDKGLIIGTCTSLRSHLTTLDNKTIHQGTVDKYPAISALGFAMCALMEYRPWLVNLNIPAIESSDPWSDTYDNDPFNAATMTRLIGDI
jgi:hypothetical protein